MELNQAISNLKDQLILVSTTNQKKGEELEREVVKQKELVEQQLRKNQEHKEKGGQFLGKVDKLLSL